MIVGLEGGLGNTLFQLAFGLSVAKARGEECLFTKYRLDSDPNGRVYELGNFCAEVPIVEREEAPLLADTWYYNPGVYDKQWKSFTGHWQTERYFDAPLVRQALKLRYPISAGTACWANRILSGPSCAIHVRRGDYLLPDRLAYHGNVTMDYYHRAMERIGKCDFFVFSDDVAWCIDAFPNCLVVRYPDQTDHEHLFLMSLCNHAIIPNSSFGWWGAWLGDTQKDRIVIGPSRWFVCGLNASDVIPDRWLKLEN
jgi:hypothetical protein